MKIKIHSFEGTNDGSVSCDFRGENFIGTAEGDHHQTLFEIDNPDTEEVATVLEFGPKINAILSKGTMSDAVAGLIGQKVGVRIGVWPDEDNKTSS